MSNIMMSEPDQQIHDKAAGRGASWLWRASAWLTIAFALVGTVSAFDALVVEPESLLTVRRMPMPSVRLAERLGAARVVHLTDLHIHGLGLRERHLVARLAEIKPDLIFITGDFGETPDGIAGITEVFARLRPRLGIFAVLGNNDHQKGQRLDIEGALRKAGVTLLVNSSAVIEAPGGPVAIVGVDDPHFGRDDIRRAMSEVPQGVPVVLLAHSADLLAPKGRALVFNPADEQGPWGEGWFWQDGAHYLPDTGEVAFPDTGKRRIRGMFREDGVALDEIRLTPIAGNAPSRRWGHWDGVEPAHVPGEIVIRASDVAQADLHGGWSRRDDLLEHGPDRGVTQSYAQLNPDSFFEAEFTAKGSVRYHTWVHLRSASMSGSSDSVFLQFTDSLNSRGEPDYRIGVAREAVDIARVDLMLTGHTHGGQVRLPWLAPLEPNVRRTPYVDGLYQVGTMWLGVSRGVGWSSLPVRFFCPPQIVVYEPPQVAAAGVLEEKHARTL